eukprot:GHRR01021167.1.p1 GENE.GHRR01021167.1~~GHRR01021167.1.p1  ORF type:complete len:281 (+),score=68.21 GHRR01021167.1:118-960(+)
MTTAYAPPTTISALKDYVSGSSSMQQSAESTVQLFITHNHLKARFPEIRLDKHMSVDAIKQKINSMTGTSVLTMTLQLKDETGRLVATLDNESRKFGFYSPRDGWVLHIIDTDDTSLSAQGWLEDVSKVTKYEISEEDYAARDNTYRKYKEQKLREDPTWTLEKEMSLRRGLPYTPAPQVGPSYQKEAASRIKPGHRCSVDPGQRRGEVKYVGQVEQLAQGHWVGVAFDEPLGKHDGSVKGKRYFECADGHGGFVRPDKVTVGDFPPIDDFSDLGTDDEI